MMMAEGWVRHYFEQDRQDLAGGHPCWACSSPALSDRTPCTAAGLAAIAAGMPDLRLPL